MKLFSIVIDQFEEGSQLAENINSKQEISFYSERVDGSDDLLYWQATKKWGLAEIRFCLL